MFTTLLIGGMSRKNTEGLRHYSSISSNVLILKSTIMMMCVYDMSINRKWLFMIITPFMSHFLASNIIIIHIWETKLYYFSTLLLLHLVCFSFVQHTRQNIYEWKFAATTSHVFFCHFINVCVFIPRITTTILQQHDTIEDYYSLYITHIIITGVECVKMCKTSVCTLQHRNSQIKWFKRCKRAHTYWQGRKIK